MSVIKLTIQRLLPDCYGQRDEPRGSNKDRLVRGGKIAMSAAPGTPAPIFMSWYPRGDGRGASTLSYHRIQQLCQNTQGMRKERARAGDVPMSCWCSTRSSSLKKDELEVPARGNPLTARARMLPAARIRSRFRWQAPRCPRESRSASWFHGQVRLLQVCALAACPHRHLLKLRPHGFRALARLCR
jgi:hypothetical protein